MNTQLRPWQFQATMQAIDWLVHKARDRHFLINAAPGAGKTLCAIAIAARLREMGEIDQVVVIAPRTEVANQWSNEFYRVTRRDMMRVTGNSSDALQDGADVCATWSAIKGLDAGFRTFCEAGRTLVICDEHHHAAVEATWGDSADQAFAKARYVLVLTGTPIRSDGAQSVWLAYDNHGRIEHPAEGTFTLTYGEAVDLEYCRPVTFHRHEGRFTVDLDNGDSTVVSGSTEAVLPTSLRRTPAVQAALEFYRLACQPKYVPGTTVPATDGYHGSMLESAIMKLDELRHRMPEAGGLVIAPSIEMAEYFAKLIERLEGEKPIVVHTETPNPEGQIQKFRTRKEQKWLISVAMVSEGVDIPRLRVLVYLPSAKTELSFRQAIGRVVRNAGPGDDTRAYVVMPTLRIFDEYARRVEDEIASYNDRDTKASRKNAKKCPSCERDNPLGAPTCSGCGHEFPQAIKRTKMCGECGVASPLGAKECERCGHDFQSNFLITFNEAMRDGTIVRSTDISEEMTRAGERMAPRLRSEIRRSGNETLIRMIGKLPDESFALLAQLIAGDKKSN